jgi:hypothetical protein
MPYFGHIGDTHGFCPYDVVPSSVVPEMVDQQNSWNSLIIGINILYIE